MNGERPVSLTRPSVARYPHPPRQSACEGGRSRSRAVTPFKSLVTHGAKRAQLRAAAVVDRLIPKSRSVLYRSFPDVCDQGIETVRALVAADVAPVTWLVDDVNDPLATGVGCRLVSTRSPLGLWAYWRAKVVVHTHGVFGSRRASKAKRFVNIWHGMPVKLLERASDVGRFQTDVTIATSAVHARHLADTWGIGLDRVELTGLPRNDVLMRPSAARPGWLGEVADDRPVVVWLPTFRRSVNGTTTVEGIDTGTATQFAGATGGAVEAAMAELGAYCVVKVHPLAEQVESWDRPNSVCLGDRALRERGTTLYELLSHADVLVTDHSSVWIDFLLTGRPIVFSISDRDRYEATRGYYFDDLDALLPGPIVSDLDGLTRELADVLGGDDRWDARRREALAFHHLHVDAGSADRVAALVARELDRS